MPSPAASSFDGLANLKRLAWFNFFSDFRLYSAVSVLYFTEVSGSFALGSSIFALTRIGAAALELPTGVLSDRLGRKKTLVAGALANFISVALYALGSSWAVLAVGALFEGAARAFFSGNNEALVYDSLKSADDESRYGEHFGRVTSTYQLALALSAALGGALASWSWGWVLWPSLGSQAVALLVTTRVQEPPLFHARASTTWGHLQEALRGLWRNSRLRQLSIASIIGFGFGEASYQFRAAFAVTVWPMWAVGLMRVVSSGLAALSFRWSGALVRRWSEVKWIIAGTVYGSGVEILGLAWPNAASPFLMSTGSAFYGVGFVSKSALMQREFTDAERATMASLTSLFGSVWMGLSALALGALADVWGPADALIAFACLGLSTTLLYWPLLKAAPSALSTPA